MISEIIYRRLNDFLPQLNNIDGELMIQNDKQVQFKAKILTSDKDCMILSLAYLYKHSSGDFIPDPCVTIKIDKSTKAANVISFENIYKIEVVCPATNLMTELQSKKNQKTQASLNKFFSQWLLHLHLKNKRNVY